VKLPSLPGAPRADRARRTERALWYIRWFGIALGVYQATNPTGIPGVNAPRSSEWIALGGLGLLVINNIIVSVAFRRRKNVGGLVFAVDIVSLWTITWAYNFNRFDQTWVILLILCLEGAHRYQLRGAMIPVALAIPLDTTREFLMHMPFQIQDVTYRVGMMAIVGAVAGAMARNLERERAQAEERAAELTRLAEAERATIERLQELDAMKSDFVAIASHELRTPLTAMQGSLKTLQQRVHLSPQQQHTLLEMLDRQTDRLAHLVEDLLIVSNIEAGGVGLQLRPTDMNSVAETLLEELGPRGVRVSCAIGPDLTEFMTDKQRFGQIARNLVENALKFSPDNSIVRVSIHREPDGLRLEVSDDGRGIAPEDIPRLFERFYQVGGALRRVGDGFGLGLYITKRLVDALDGQITVDTEIGKGTTFKIWFPNARDAAEEIA
jgi:signal transduction histidine kinase